MAGAISQREEAKDYTQTAQCSALQGAPAKTVSYLNTLVMQHTDRSHTNNKQISVYTQHYLRNIMQMKLSIISLYKT